MKVKSLGLGHFTLIVFSILLVSLGLFFSTQNAFAEPQIEVTDISKKRNEIPVVFDTWQIELKGTGFIDTVWVEGSICKPIDRDCDSSFRIQTDESGNFITDRGFVHANGESGIYEIKASDGVNNFAKEVFLELQEFPENSLVWTLNKETFKAGVSEVVDIRGEYADDLFDYNGISLHFVKDGFDFREYFSVADNKFHFVKTMTFPEAGTWELILEFSALIRTQTFEVITDTIPEKELTVEEPEIEDTVSLESKSKLPDWVRNIFIWYAEDGISEDELLGAIQFLIQQGIIKI